MHIVFDFGGVVFHWDPPTLIQRELPDRATDHASGVHWAAEFFQSYGGDWAEFDRGTIEPAELVQRIVRRTGLSPADVQRVLDAVPYELAPESDVVSLMRRLMDAGHTLHYLSNMPAPYARHLEEANHFMTWFDSGVFSSREHVIKPEPAIYQLAARRFGQEPRALLFIDDTLSNVVAARDLGWQALPFVSAAQLQEDLVAGGYLPQTR